MSTENYPAWQLRVMEEKAQLDIKKSHLYAFLDKGLPDDFDHWEWIRLSGQYAVMCSYSHILGERIANFK